MSAATCTRVTHTADPFETAQRELEQLFGLTSRPRSEAVNSVDVREDADRFYVEAELPGFAKEQIDITLENNVLAITAQRPQAAQQEGYLLRERRLSSFQRRFTLPPTVDGGNVEAKFENGVLYLTLSKRQEAKARKIAVA